MSIRIDTSRCIGCGRCAGVCPGSLLRVSQSGVAEISSPRDCWGCCSCLKECPSRAISMYLGADIGGRGTQMTFTRIKGLNCWMFTRADGSSMTVEVDPKNANKY
ncbi:ferredoxin family protein [Succinimonas sp.]|uniref:4Fe-4S dicluster domain-containing protein n=1 Tax=Succinimonas sp. TaxID=1936151 RepID=UPI00386FC507